MVRDGRFREDLLYRLNVITMRGVFWAPMGEVGIPQRITGSAFGIACLLGYEDTTSFYRAFRSWEGTTPARWRALQAPLPAL